jgi:hypothetical protein
MLGDSLKKVYRIDETPCFPELLEAIDRTDREHWRADDRKKVVERLARLHMISGHGSVGTRRRELRCSKMPMFYMHFSNGDGLTEDEEGLELGDSTTARSAAIACG